MREYTHPNVFVCALHPLSPDDSLSIPSVVSEHEAFLPRMISQRRFSSHATGSAASQPEAPRATMLPSHR